MLWWGGVGLVRLAINAPLVKRGKLVEINRGKQCPTGLGRGLG